MVIMCTKNTPTIRDNLNNEKLYQRSSGWSINFLQNKPTLKMKQLFVLKFKVKLIIDTGVFMFDIESYYR